VENFTNFEKKLLLYLFECASEIKNNCSAIRPSELSFAEEPKEFSSEPVPKNIFLELAQIEEKIGIDSWTLESSLKKLFEIKYIKEFEEEKHFFSLFSALAINKSFLYFEFSEKIWTNLSCYYFFIEELIVRSFKCKHTEELYKFFTSGKENYKITLFSELKELTQTQELVGYIDFGIFEKKILIPSINEINEKSDIRIKYEKIKEKKIVSVKFSIFFTNDFKKNTEIPIINFPKNLIALSKEIIEKHYPQK